jgi:hypothetical protein
VKNSNLLRGLVFGVQTERIFHFAGKEQVASVREDSDCDSVDKQRRGVGKTTFHFRKKI